MRLSLEITKEEIKKYKRAYATACVGPHPPRLDVAGWITREILNELPSGATSRKGQWAVDATLKPAIARVIQSLVKPTKGATT
jgi:hypothetical protein